MENNSSSSITRYLMALSVLMMSMMMTCPPHVQARRVNGYDDPFTFSCSRGQFLAYIGSDHFSFPEDRRFDLSCRPLPPVMAGTHSLTENIVGCAWSDYVNDFDEWQTYQCPGRGGYIAGMSSYHSDRHEDRRFRFYCCNVPGAATRNCADTGYQNRFDHDLNYLVPDGKILKGMTSYHSNHHEDRRFKFTICDLSRDNSTS